MIESPTYPMNLTLAYNPEFVKNTGAYLINRKAAQACTQKMLPMQLPYDVALDRDWDFDFKTACIVPFPVVCKNFVTQIHKRQKNSSLSKHHISPVSHTHPLPTHRTSQTLRARSRRAIGQCIQNPSSALPLSTAVIPLMSQTVS